MSVARSIAGNTIVQVAGKAVATILGVATVAVMTRHLGRDGYGGFTTAMTFLQFFGVLADFGLTLAMSKLLAAPDADQKKVASNIFTLRLVLSLGLFALAPLLAFAFPYPGAIRLAIAIGALSYLQMTLSNVLSGIFLQRLSMRFSMIAEIAGRALLLALVIAAAKTGAGLSAFMWALVISNSAQFLICFAFARRLVSVGLACDRRMWLAIVKESWPIAVSIAFNLVYLKGDVIILSVFRTQSEVGLYGAAYKVLDVVTVIPTAFMGLVMPVLAGVWLAGDRADFKRKLGRAFDFLTIIALPLAAGALVVGRDLMTFVAGQDFADAGGLLAILMIAGAMVFWSALFGHTIVAIGIQRMMMWFYGLDAALSLLLYVWAIPRWGAPAAAWVTVFSEAFIAIATTVAVSAKVGSIPSFKNAGKAALSALLMALVVLALPGLHVALRIAVGAAAYGTLIFAFGTVDRGTFMRLLNRRPAV